jgi:hypothetical protein
MFHELGSVITAPSLTAIETIFGPSALFGSVGVVYDP